MLKQDAVFRLALSALRQLTSAIESLSDQQKKYTQAQQSTANAESHIPEAIRALDDIRDRLDTFIANDNTNSKANNAYQGASLSSQRWMVLLTMGAFGAAAYYALVAKWQLESMNESLRSNQRAFISAGDPTQLLKGRDQTVTVPIQNYGHVSSVGPTFTFYYSRFRNSDKITVESRQYIVKRDDAIAPGPAGYQLQIVPPILDYSSQAAVMSAQQIEMITTRITYDTGFGYSDTFQFCIGYIPTVAAWASCGKTASYINLNEEKPQAEKR